MKLIIQIPCFNEADNLPDVVKNLPKSIPGIDVIETLIIDDGSTDGTIITAQKLGVNHIVCNTCNQGLARSFHTGIEQCLQQGADIIVNTDGDNQYAGEDICKLVQPIVEGGADIVIGDRGGYNNVHFSFHKRCLQVLGSFVIKKATGLKISDAVSGFRAISRKAAQQINIVSDFSYTIEMLIQASAKCLCVKSVPIKTNQKTRDSRLFKSIPQFILMSFSTLLRIYSMYKPLKVFLSIGLVLLIIGSIPVIRFMYFYINGGGDGHVQSLVLGGTIIILGFITFIIGLIADLINFNRKLLEKMIHKMEKLEDKVDAYEADRQIQEKNPEIVRILNSKQANKN